MALLYKADILSAFQRLGQLASEQGEQVTLIVVGGAAMVLGFEARQSTHDVDTVFTAPGIEVRLPSVIQLLAMKPSAWRDDVDISDALRLLEAVGKNQDAESLWKTLEPYLIPGEQLKAQYAFQDLWELLYA